MPEPGRWAVTGMHRFPGLSEEPQRSGPRFGEPARKMHWPSGEASPAWAVVGHPVPGRGRGLSWRGGSVLAAQLARLQKPAS